MSSENLNQPKSSPDPVGSATDEAPRFDINQRLEQITTERDKLAAEKAELQDLLLRRQADHENFRRRAERDRSEFVQFASSEIVRELLPVLDDFDRAMAVPCGDAEFLKGVELIHNRLRQSLQKQGLEAIDTTGKMFDPNLHEAVQRVETTEHEDQAILGEMQRGYNFKGRLLRPAMVRVAVRP